MKIGCVESGGVRRGQPLRRIINNLDITSIMGVEIGGVENAYD